MTDQETPREDPPRRGYAAIIREAEEFSHYWHGIGNPSTNLGNAISTIDELLDLHKRMSASHEPHELSFEARSEVHTSELQSHSFISYAVFCLKKKKK